MGYKRLEVIEILSHGKVKVRSQPFSPQSADYFLTHCKLVFTSMKPENNYSRIGEVIMALIYMIAKYVRSSQRGACT